LADRVPARHPRPGQGPHRPYREVYRIDAHNIAIDVHKIDLRVFNAFSGTQLTVGDNKDERPESMYVLRSIRRVKGLALLLADCVPARRPRRLVDQIEAGPCLRSLLHTFKFEGLGIGSGSISILDLIALSVSRLCSCQTSGTTWPRASRSPFVNACPSRSNRGWSWSQILLPYLQIRGSGHWIWTNFHSRFDRSLDSQIAFLPDIRDDLAKGRTARLKILLENATVRGRA